MLRGYWATYQGAGAHSAKLSRDGTAQLLQRIHRAARLQPSYVLRCAASDLHGDMIAIAAGHAMTAWRV